MPVNNFFHSRNGIFFKYPQDQLLDSVPSQMYPGLKDIDLCPFHICLAIVPLFTHNSSFPPRGNFTLEIWTKILYDFLNIFDTELCA